MHKMLINIKECVLEISYINEIYDQIIAQTKDNFQSSYFCKYN